MITFPDFNNADYLHYSSRFLRLRVWLSKYSWSSRSRLQSCHHFQISHKQPTINNNPDEKGFFWSGPSWPFISWMKIHNWTGWTQRTARGSFLSFGAAGGRGSSTLGFVSAKVPVATRCAPSMRQSRERFPWFLADRPTLSPPSPPPVQADRDWTWTGMRPGKLSWVQKEWNRGEGGEAVSSSARGHLNVKVSLLLLTETACSQVAYPRPADRPTDEPINRRAMPCFASSVGCGIAMIALRPGSSRFIVDTL